MKYLLIVLQLALSSLIVLLILIQNKGTGFGRVWGGSNISFTRRGLEKIVFRLTFIVVGAFIVVSTLLLII